MARERLSMRKIREILRLKLVCGLSNRQIARSCAVCRPTVAEYVRKAEEIGLLDWKEIELLPDCDLEQKFTVHLPAIPPGTKPMPDYDKVHEELRNKDVTLALLWDEYKVQHPEGYQYSQFAYYYSRYRRRLGLVMRQNHKAGEKVFVDFCDGLKIIDPVTSEAILTQLFVGVWGASNYTYAEATMSQELSAWTGCHVRAFEYFGCCPHIAVPDNLKSGIKRPCRYDPEVNPTYAALAAHYGFAVIPARPYHPRDKAKVEAGVLLAQRWILAVLRHRRFYSLAELNSAIWELLDKLNTRLMKKIKKSRREMFEQIDRPQAKSLPERPWEFAEWKKARVNIDYHIEIESHYYSVPFKLVHEEVMVRLTAQVLEVLYRGDRVTSHARSYVKWGHTTLEEHMPPAHRAYAEWTPSRIIAWAGKTGPSTAQLVGEILRRREHPEQGYRAALGILRLGKRYGQDRLEKSCQRAVVHHAFSYKSVQSILSHGLDRCSEDSGAEQPPLPWHKNIRGGDYYLS